MTRLPYLLLILALTGCGIAPSLSAASTPEPAPLTNLLSPPNLPDMGPAPELANETWLNVDAPLRLADLQGRVIIVEMWTFGCINCQHVIPSLKEWHSRYKDQGLVIIGNHFPEFDYESDLQNLKDAVARSGIQYAVAQDNDGATWKAYNNHYWPALYLIDKHGRIRYIHIGEGAYKQTEAALRALLAEN